MHTILKFSYNWNNKLLCRAFTTIRASDKYPAGTIVQVECKNVPPFLGRVVERRKLTKPDLNEAMCLLDTGYSREETLQILYRMYPSSTSKTPIYWHVVQRIKEAEAHPSPSVDQALAEALRPLSTTPELSCP